MDGSVAKMLAVVAFFCGDASPIRDSKVLAVGRQQDPAYKARDSADTNVKKKELLLRAAPSEALFLIAKIWK
jgi:hypothetical protein